MKARWTLLPLIAWTLLIIAKKVNSSATFELRLISFINDAGLNADGNCCNGLRTSSDRKCSSSCNTFFWICLTHFQTNIVRNGHCTFGYKITPVIGNNSVQFSSLSTSKFNNPVQFTLNDRWLGTFSLIIEAWHDSTMQGPKPGSPRELISRLETQRSVSVGDTWNTYNENIDSNRLHYSYRVICDEHYFGSGCTNFCKPRNDEFGHYTCNPDGSKACMAGWKGNYCMEAECLRGCHRDHGYCQKLNECTCRPGWTGRFCDQCLVHPSCLHGTCNGKPFDCVCDEGWGGIHCNLDLNYCTHHHPCKNNGTCYNTGQGSYTCMCKPGFNGTNCDIRVNHCVSDPCRNGGSCTDLGSTFSCKCPSGFYGHRCEAHGAKCSRNKCINGGTCVIHDHQDVCVCPSRFQGSRCQHEINRCESGPCQNGGQCINEINSYRCICQIGYRGSRCSVRIQQCSENPCLNGATCIDQTSGFECMCRNGYVGRLCQRKINHCDLTSCANGGKCENLANDYKCNCVPGFTGRHCNHNVDDCKDNPCQNGGLCYDRVYDYKCSCLNGYFGKDCEHADGDVPTIEPDTTEIALPGNIGGSHGDDDESTGLSTKELVLIVCLGAGIPLVVIIIAILFILLRKQRLLNRNTEEDYNSDKENRENERNMNNKLGGGESPTIFTTSVPQPPQPSSSSNPPYKLTSEPHHFSSLRDRHKYYEKDSKNTNIVNDLGSHHHRYSSKDYNVHKSQSQTPSTRWSGIEVSDDSRWSDVALEEDHYDKSEDFQRRHHSHHPRVHSLTRQTRPRSHHPHTSQDSRGTTSHIFQPHSHHHHDQPPPPPPHHRHSLYSQSSPLATEV